MKGSKLVSDLLIDRKLNLWEKNQVRVLVSGEEIMWVLGIQASDTFKITEGSKRVLVIKKA
jgi:tRNA(Ile)-lysidine synthase